ncbi:hypothetical protein ACFVSK_02390 [Cellulosimicrobium cellulans]|uniref:hypothetical protein n=1 Tax=Cellulosimicrobium cellulans TaxID=1710 RepID=UPI0036EEE623
MANETLPPVGSTGSVPVYNECADGTVIAVHVDYRIGTAGVDITGIKVWADGGRAITSEALASVAEKVHGWAAESAAQEWAKHLARQSAVRYGPGRLTIGEGDDAISFDVGDATITPAIDSDAVKRARAELEGRRRRRHESANEERLRRTAAAYMAADGPKLAAVQAELSVSRATAARYIKSAKEAGFIPTNGGE